MAKTIPQNESTVDRFIRIIVGGACLIVPSYLSLPNTVMFVLLIIGLYLMFSGLSGHCIAYRLLGVKTCK